MTDKAKERIQRNCFHLTLLRAKDYANDDAEWSDLWQCADCGWVLQLFCAASETIGVGQTKGDA